MVGLHNSSLNNSSQSVSLTHICDSQYMPVILEPDHSDNSKILLSPPLCSFVSARFFLVNSVVKPGQVDQTWSKSVTRFGHTIDFYHGDITLKDGPCRLDRHVFC